MPRYNVETEYTCRFEKTLTIYARDEEEAEEKAHDIVSGWSGVEDVEIKDVEEE